MPTAIPQKRLDIILSGELAVLLDVLVWQVQKQCKAERRRAPTRNQVFSAIFLAYVIDNKQAILDAISNEAERALAEESIRSCRSSSLLRFGYRKREPATRAKRRGAGNASVGGARAPDVGDALPLPEGVEIPLARPAWWER